MRSYTRAWVRVHACVCDNRFNKYGYMQTHPNVDKEAFRSDGLIRLKQAQRPFPLHSDVGVLKWRLAHAPADDRAAPLAGTHWAVDCAVRLYDWTVGVWGGGSLNSSECLSGEVDVGCTAISLPYRARSTWGFQSSSPRRLLY